MQLVVIGGGAAGFFGAIASATTFPNHSVTVLEAGRQLLAKVRISGGGRCNVTHACYEPALLVQNYPRGGKALRGALTQFQPKDTIQWFSQRGVQLKVEPDGRLFPVTDDSDTIVQCLLAAARSAGIQIRTGTPVTRVIHSGQQFQIQLRAEEPIIADRILLATGSQPVGYQIAQSLGHTIEPPVPSLFTFNITDRRLQDLAGISVPQAQLKLQTPDGGRWEQTGPLLITHWGLSGPAVLKLSAWAARSLHADRYHASLKINWLPSLNQDAVRQQLLAWKTEASKRTLTSHCPFDLPRRLWQSLIAAVGITAEIRWADLPNKALNQLTLELTQGSYSITGKGVFKDEFVTCGGVKLAEVNFKTMESRCTPGLYFAGEILDIDGITGGFNFQSAWTTGWIAGHAIGNS